MTLRFQLAGPYDENVLLTMMAELQADDPWSCPFDPELALQALDDLLREPSLGRVWIIFDADQPIGYIVMAFDYSLEYRGRGAWVDEFFIRRSHRGRGIGTQALEFFAAQAKEIGVKVVHLEVNHGNPAVELYRRLGFEDHHRYLMTKWIADKP